jgi:hypothetical protein
VSIEVGPEHRRYVLHKALLLHYSDYFRNALNGSWMEAEDRTITLDDVEPGTFNVFVDWLYSQKFPTTDKDWQVVTETEDESDLNIIKTCAFGDRFMVPKLFQDANNHYVDAKLNLSLYSIVIYAFNNLRSDTPLLKFLVDLHCAVWQRTCDDTDEDEKALQPQLPNDFLVRVMYRYSELRETKIDGTELDRCSYHVHTSDEEREECRRKIEI